MIDWRTRQGDVEDLGQQPYQSFEGTPTTLVLWRGEFVRYAKDDIPFFGSHVFKVDDPHDITPIVSLQLSLERLENARDTLKLN